VRLVKSVYLIIVWSSSHRSGDYHCADVKKIVSRKRYSTYVPTLHRGFLTKVSQRGSPKPCFRAISSSDFVSNTSGDNLIKIRPSAHSFMYWALMVPT